jgi:translocation and assembly module TamA
MSPRATRSTAAIRPVLLQGGTVVTMDPQRRVMEGDVLLDGGRIAGVGRELSPPKGATTLDCRGRAVLPGLIQAHVHLCQTLFRGRADGLELLDWLRTRIWPLEMAHDEKSMAISARLGIAELLLGGTTAVLDMGTVHHQGTIFEVAEETGIRYTGGKAMMDAGNDLPAEMKEETEAAVESSLELAKRWHGAGSGRLRYALCPRFVLSCSESLWRAVGEISRRDGLRIHTHASENLSEVEVVRHAVGMDNVAYFQRLGLTGPSLVLAHCIHLTTAEQDALASSGTHAVHCPGGNLKLGSGTAPIPLLMAKGVNVALGADGAACNNSLDVFQEMRLAATVHLPQFGPQSMPPTEVVAMATVNGARALGLESEIGTIEEGKAADVTVVDLTGPHLAPAGPDVCSTLVYGARATDVEHVFVEGRHLVRKRKLVSLNAGALAKAAAVEGARILSRAEKLFGILGVALLALATMGTGCLSHQATPERPLVKALSIRGTDEVDEDDVEEKLATRESGLFIWSDAHYLDPDVLAADRQRIVRYYRSEGHYHARVDDVQVRTLGPEKVKVIFRVVEGPPVKVKEVVVEGLENIPKLEAARELPLKVGDVFTEGAYDAAKNALTSALREAGYALAEVTQSAEVDIQRNEARVRYQATPGDRYRFGNVFVAGAAAIPRARIREEAEVAIPTGEIFSESKVAAAQGRVFDLGVFGGVRVSQGTPNEQKKTIPVVIAVREAPFRTIRLGGGAGFQASRWEGHLIAGWTHRNWFGSLRKLSLDARVGYAFLPNALAFIRDTDDPETAGERKHGLVGLAAADFTQPGILSRRVDVNVRLEAERGIEQAYAFYAERFRIGLPLKLHRKWTLVPSYNLEVYQLEQAGSGAFGGLATGSSALVSSCPDRQCVLSFLEQRIAWDARDDAINTRSGIYAGLALQEGFKLLDIGFRYLRVIPEIRGFLPLGSRLVLASRFRVGALMPLGPEPGRKEDLQTPIVQRFTAGGPNSMRGYNTRRLAPMALDVRCSPGMSPSRRPYDCGLVPVPVGGNGLADGSVELRFDIWGDLGGVTFLDAGNVTRAFRDALRLQDLQYAAGMGLRYKTLFGPVRLDFAYRLPRREGGRWRLPTVPIYDPVSGQDIGFQEENAWAVQVSLGEAF